MKFASGFGSLPGMGLDKLLSTALSPRQDMERFLKSINWPSELQALGEFMLSWILAKAQGEDVPLAITTQRGGGASW
jgi:hypothetical protein